MTATSSKTPDTGSLPEYFDRPTLARRWGVSIRTIDRLRMSGRLPWVDLSGGVGAKPLVRVRRCDALQYEQRCHMDPRHVAAA